MEFFILLKETVVKIRQSNNEDLVRCLHKITFPHDSYEHHHSSRYWIVTDEDKYPVGFCMCHPLTFENNTVFLSRAGLLDCARGKGLHMRMIKVRVSWAKRQGYKAIITYTSLDNASSFHNLQKAGFKLYLPENLYVGKSFLYWRKDI